MTRVCVGAVMIMTGVAMGGCSSTPPAAAPVELIEVMPVVVAARPIVAEAAKVEAPTVAATPVVASPSVAAPVPAPLLLPHQLPRSLIYRDRSIYFDFGSAVVKPGNLALIERHGSYLASQPNLSIKVEGNTDERGSVKYNMALGQKRASAVIKALKASGARDSQMEAVSWGEERPKLTGHHQAAWAENRRVDLVYIQH